MLATIQELMHLMDNADKGFTTTKIENILGFFLPSKNITNSKIQKEFLANNQHYIIKDDTRLSNNNYRKTFNAKT